MPPPPPLESIAGAARSVGPPSPPTRPRVHPLKTARSVWGHGRAAVGSETVRNDPSPQKKKEKSHALVGLHPPFLDRGIERLPVRGPPEGRVMIQQDSALNTHESPIARPHGPGVPRGGVGWCTMRKIAGVGRERERERDLGWNAAEWLENAPIL